MRLNEAQLTFRHEVAFDTFETVKLTLGPVVKSKNNRSPVIRSVKLVPTD